MNSNKNIPQLRFPEFNGEWEEKVMSDVFTRRTEKNAEDNKNVLTISAQYGLISQLEFFKKSVSAADVTGYYLLHKGDFAYNKSSSQGKPVGAIKPLKLYEKGVVSTLYIVFRCKDPNAIGFWEQYFDAGIFDNEIMSIAQEGARNHGLLNVPTNDFFGLNVLSPSPAEQQKIAECLSEIDNLIAAQGEKVDALMEKKKGMMQQMFPQKGETAPRLRFPGFTGEWGADDLANLTERVFVGLATSVTPYYRSKGVVMFRNLNIKADELDDRDVLYLDEAFASANPSKIIHADDVLTVHTGYVGISCIVPKKYEGALTFTTLVTTTQKKVLNPRYLCCYLNSDSGAREIVRLQAGGGRNNLNVNDFIRLRVPLPPSIAEQIKIAECLTALNNLIISESAKLDTLKDHKKGLMQQLFPQTSK